jgi:UPF0716 family protein affecting phage T7 exclusion
MQALNMIWIAMVIGVFAVVFLISLVSTHVF